MCHEITNPETVVIDHADVLIPLFSAPGRQPDLRIQCLFFTGERLHAGKFLIIRRFGNITFFSTAGGIRLALVIWADTLPIPSINIHKQNKIRFISYILILHSHRRHGHALLLFAAHHLLQFIHQCFVSQIFTDDPSFLIQD